VGSAVVAEAQSGGVGAVDEQGLSRADEIPVFERPFGCYPLAVDKRAVLAAHIRHHVAPVDIGDNKVLGGDCLVFDGYFALVRAPHQRRPG
jgi:hypothetical protein